MTKVEELKKLESLLESFLDEALKLKGSRLKVVQAINRLDDIARKYVSGSLGHNEIGGWFAHHNEWHNGKELRKTDRNRIGSILNTIRTELDKTDSDTAEIRKLKTEIDRWVIRSVAKKAKPVVEEPELKPGRKIVLKRPAENQPDDLSEIGRASCRERV